MKRSILAVVVFGAVCSGSVKAADVAASDVKFSNGWDLETVNQQQNAVAIDHEDRIADNRSAILKTNQENLLRDDQIKTADDKADAALKGVVKNGSDIITMQGKVDNNTSAITGEANQRHVADLVLQRNIDTKVSKPEFDTDQSRQDSRIAALENAPKPQDGKDGAQGVAGKDGNNGKDGLDGKDGITTTINKVQIDTATQAKVAANSQQISTTTNQAASVAKDLQDAKSVFAKQQTASNARFKSLSDKVEGNKKEARSGVASAVAIASMPQVEAGQKFMFSAGVGSFKDEQAVSVGASFHAGSATVKAGISESTNDDLALGAGVGFGF